jgi:hypothetical protein
VNPTFQLRRIAGIRIGVNWSWLIVFVLIVWSLAAARTAAPRHRIDGAPG